MSGQRVDYKYCVLMFLLCLSCGLFIKYIDEVQNFGNMDKLIFCFRLQFFYVYLVW